MNLESMSSPEVVRVSTASDLVLFQKVSRFLGNAMPMTINLLLHFPDGCKGNCLYCGQARESPPAPSDRDLIRVPWPLRLLDDVIEGLKRLSRSGLSFRPWRVCIASVTHYRAVEALMEVAKRIRKELPVPITALVTPTLFGEEEFRELLGIGVERVGIAIDCANPQLFDLLRGKKAKGPHRWERYLQGVEEAIEVFGKGRVGIHIIVGLGESERDCVELMQRVHDMGGETHLFAFYPEPYSALSDWPRVHVGQYRRVQLARYLIDCEIARAEEMKFNCWGQIIDFGISRKLLNEVIESGLPFTTSGCPGCNRPWANERPSDGYPMNFPWIPRGTEIEIIKKQLLEYEVPPKATIENLINYLEARGILGQARGDDHTPRYESCRFSTTNRDSHSDIRNHPRLHAPNDILQDSRFRR